MPAKELALLTEDMRENGYDARFPIIWYEGLILDGRNRWLASQAADVEADSLHLAPNADPVLFVRRANEHRRHLSLPWLKQHRAERIKRVAEARQQGKSTRTIAEEEGVSQTQVVADLETATEQGCSVDPKLSTGKDGKKRPATRKKQAEPPAEKAEPEPAPEPAPPPEIPTDNNGRELPAQAIAAFEQLPEIKAASKDFDALAKRVEAIAEGPAGSHLRGVRAADITGTLKRLKKSLWSMRPYLVCPYCKGKKPGCNVCKGDGWVTQVSYDRAPAETKEDAQ